MRISHAATAAIALLLVPAAGAQAHIVGARLGDFYAGALHPMTDPQDVILWVALGVLAGSLGAARGRWLVLVFPLGLMAGLAIGLHAGFTAFGMAGDAAATLVMGLLLAAALPLPVWALCAIAAGLGAMRGAVNAAGAGQGTNQVLFGAGLGVAGYVVITLTMALAAAFRDAGRRQAGGWRVIAIRACGSWIAAIGLMMGGFALAR